MGHHNARWLPVAPKLTKSVQDEGKAPDGRTHTNKTKCLKIPTKKIKKVDSTNPMGESLRARLHFL